MSDTLTAVDVFDAGNFKVGDKVIVASDPKRFGPWSNRVAVVQRVDVKDSHGPIPFPISIRLGDKAPVNPGPLENLGFPVCASEIEKVNL